MCASFGTLESTVSMPGVGVVVPVPWGGVTTIVPPVAFGEPNEGALMPLVPVVEGVVAGGVVGALDGTPVLRLRIDEVLDVVWVETGVFADFVAEAATGTAPLQPQTKKTRATDAVAMSFTFSLPFLLRSGRAIRSALAGRRRLSRSRDGEPGP